MENKVLLNGEEYNIEDITIISSYEIDDFMYRMFGITTKKELIDFISQKYGCFSDELRGFSIGCGFVHEGGVRYNIKDKVITLTEWYIVDIQKCIDINEKCFNYREMK